MDNYPPGFDDREFDDPVINEWEGDDDEEALEEELAILREKE